MGMPTTSPRVTPEGKELAHEEDLVDILRKTRVKEA
jgi:hypothetical protein